MEVCLKELYSSNQTEKYHVRSIQLCRQPVFCFEYICKTELLINSATELIDKSFQTNKSSEKACNLLITANRRGKVRPRHDDKLFVDA